MQPNSLGDGGAFAGQTGDIMSNVVNHHSAVARPPLQNFGGAQSLTQAPASLPRPIQPIFSAAAAVSSTSPWEPDSSPFERQSLKQKENKKKSHKLRMKIMYFDTLI